MWALGETIFRAITGEPTFGKLQDLCSYQQSRIGFPVEALTALDVEEDATNFICSLMKSKPYQRLDVFRASKHVWLLKDKKETGPAQEYTTEVKEQDYGMNTLKAGQGGDLTGTATMVARSQGRMPTQSLPSTPALQEYPRGDRTRDKGKAPKTSPADPIQPPLETFRINSLEPATKKRSRKLLWSDWSAWTRSNTDERYYRQRQDEDGMNGFPAFYSFHIANVFI
jgi:hypothetical protein